MQAALWAAPWELYLCRSWCRAVPMRHVEGSHGCSTRLWYTAHAMQMCRAPLLTEQYVHLPKNKKNIVGRGPRPAPGAGWGATCCPASTGLLSQKYCSMACVNMRVLS